MAARKMMERENVLNLSTIQTLFNKFFRNGQKYNGMCSKMERCRFKMSML